MEELIAKINQKSNFPDISKFNPDNYFYSETTLVYFDEKGKFHYPVRIRICRHKTCIFCALWVIYGQYELRGGGSCSVGKSSSKQIAIQEALDLAGIEISPDLIDSGLSGLGFRAQEEVAIAIAHALELDPKRWTLVSCGAG